MHCKANDKSLLLSFHDSIRCKKETDPKNNVVAIPKGLNELMADIAKEVIRERPDNMLAFIAQYLENQIVTRNKFTEMNDFLDDTFYEAQQEILTKHALYGLDEKTAHAAASKIQALFRGHRVRKSLRPSIGFGVKVCKDDDDDYELDSEYSIEEDLIARTTLQLQEDVMRKEGQFEFRGVSFSAERTFKNPDFPDEMSIRIQFDDEDEKTSTLRHSLISQDSRLSGFPLTRGAVETDLPRVPSDYQISDASVLEPKTRPQDLHKPHLEADGQLTRQLSAIEKPDDNQGQMTRQLSAIENPDDNKDQMTRQLSAIENPDDNKDQITRQLSAIEKPDEDNAQGQLTRQLSAIEKPDEDKNAQGQLTRQLSNIEEPVNKAEVVKPNDRASQETQLRVSVTSNEGKGTVVQETPKEIKHDSEPKEPANIQTETATVNTQVNDDSTDENQNLKADEQKLQQSATEVENKVPADASENDATT